MDRVVYGLALVGWLIVAAQGVFFWSTFDESVDWRMRQVNAPLFWKIEKVLNKHERRITDLERKYEGD